MARTAIAPTQVTRAGVWPSQTVGVADGHKFDNNGRCWVEVENIDAVSRTVTIPSTKTVLNLAVDDLAVVIPTAEKRIIGPFPGDTFNVQNGSDAGYCYVNYEAGKHDKFKTRVFRL